jgi:hypothetical protein
LTDFLIDALAGCIGIALGQSMMNLFPNKRVNNWRLLLAGAAASAKKQKKFQKDSKMDCRAAVGNW